MKPKVAYAAVTTAAVVAGTIAFTMASSQAETNAAADALAPVRLAASGADSLIAAQPKLFQLAPGDQLQQEKVTRGGALQYVSLRRSYRGLPVTGGDAVVVTNAQGQPLSTWTAQEYRLKVNTKATVSAAAAEKVARGLLTKVDKVVAPALTVVAQDSGKLAYEVVVSGAKKTRKGLINSRQRIFVDAHTGKVLPKWTLEEIVDESATGRGFYYNPVTIDTTRSGSSFRMVDPNRPGINCSDMNGQIFSQTGNSWGSGKDLQAACVDAMYAAKSEWSMLSEWLGRNGIDGQGRGFPMHVGWDQTNAQWDTAETEFGRSDDGQRPLTNIDVVAHEFGHAIVQYTPGGGWVDNGMNESAADIFGALTEAYANNPKDKPDYEVGELANLYNEGPIRYMYDPSKAGHANCYTPANNSAEVHAAAGPQNHFFYLLAEGSRPTNGQPASPTCNGRTVTSIGIRKAGQIWMGALMRKTSGWSHSKARAATVAAAKELFPVGAECATVKAAWDAVTVPAIAGEVDCGPTNIPPTAPGSSTPTGAPRPTPTLSPTTTPSKGPDGTPAPKPTACPGFAHYDSGDLAEGERTYSYEFAAAAGRHQACLNVPAGADFDLYLERKSAGGSWLTVASAMTSGGDEAISYAGSAGTYRYRVVAYTGSGFSTLGFNNP